jgi:hypothetical protein
MIVLGNLCGDDIMLCMLKKGDFRDISSSLGIRLHVRLEEVERIFPEMISRAGHRPLGYEAISNIISQP